jgi:anthranilate/para-aminobenzoate synthase component II
MWQDVDMHGRDHMARTFGTNIEVLLSSMHHQMMMPNKETENIILLVANESTKKERMSEMDDMAGHVPNVTVRYSNNAHPDDDIEALYYPETNCLCFQPHPELYMSSKQEKYKPMVDLFFSYINQYCFDTEQEAA